MPTQTSRISGPDVLKTIGLQFFLPADQGIDWNIVASLAFDLSEDTPIDKKDKYGAIYSDIIELVSPMIAAETGYSDTRHLALVFDRRDWIVATIDNIKELFGKIIDDYWRLLDKSLYQSRASTIAKKGAKALITSEVGLLLGYLSGKVLAQYDMVLPGRQLTDSFLYFVEPNIQLKENQLALGAAPFRFWLVLHELAHSFQFENNSWLKNYYVDLIEESRSIIKDKAKSRASESKLTWGFLSSPANLKLINKIQAFMSVIEGYADYVMMEVGKKIPGYEDLMPAFLRRKPSSLLMSLVEKLLGLDLKISQYKVGVKFVKEVVALKSFSFLNEALSCPENLPTIKELYQPEDWVKRIKSQKSEGDKRDK